MAFFESRKEKREVVIGLAAGVVSGVASILIASNYIATKASEKAFSKTFMMGKMEKMEQNRSVSIQTEYIYGNGSRNESRNRNIKNMNGMNMAPKLTVSITTSEFYNGEWTPVLKHTFYGESEEELADLINAHRTTDVFFRSSFTGNFDWKGSTIKLKNSEPKIEYSQ